MLLPQFLQPLVAASRFPLMADSTPLVLTVNGRRHELSCEPWVTLLDLLRERLDLTGSKKGCDHGQCGACTVLIDGRRKNACLLLAVALDGMEITTIEGLATNGELHPMQASFQANHGLQCGYCTPGMIMAATSFLKENPNPSEEEIRHGLEGNLCRCTGYHNIVKAVAAVANG
jgi:aerobic-type carbon monoxide dehydrogenase small subunit (CoxS/CutS family)